MKKKRENSCLFARVRQTQMQFWKITADGWPPARLQLTWVRIDIDHQSKELFNLIAILSNTLHFSRVTFITPLWIINRIWTWWMSENMRVNGLRSIRTHWCCILETPTYTTRCKWNCEYGNTCTSLINIAYWQFFIFFYSITDSRYSYYLVLDILLIPKPYWNSNLQSLTSDGI